MPNFFNKTKKDRLRNYNAASTKINYTLPYETNVQLQVFTIEGELVKSLLDERQSASVYSIEFDASNLASGTYLFRLNAGGFIQTKKMTLTK